MAKVTSPNMKFWNIVVMEGYKTLFSQRCFSVQEANELLKVKREEFPDRNKYSVTRENY